ncbi:MAG: hypothetical protein RR192_04435 [Peptostreptococcaceae bacterium]
MKHGRKLTKKQWKLLEDNRFNPSEWLLERHTENGLVFVHRVTKELSPPIK